MFDKLHEECGIFGIHNHPEASNLTYLGLYALQHRGQESVGIAAANGERVKLSRALGYVADSFSAQALAALPGETAMGHVKSVKLGEKLRRMVDTTFADRLMV